MQAASAPNHFRRAELSDYVAGGFVTARVVSRPEMQPAPVMAAGMGGTRMSVRRVSTMTKMTAAEVAAAKMTTAGMTATSAAVLSLSRSGQAEQSRHCDQGSAHRAREEGFGHSCPSSERALSVLLVARILAGYRVVTSMMRISGYWRFHCAEI